MHTCLPCYLGCCTCNIKRRLLLTVLRDNYFMPDSFGSVPCTVYTEQSAKFWDSSFELAEYIKPKIQRQHLFADVRLEYTFYLCVHCSNSGTLTSNTQNTSNPKHTYVVCRRQLSADLTIYHLCLRTCYR